MILRILLSISALLLFLSPAFADTDSGDDFLNQLRTTELTAKEIKKQIVDSICRELRSDYKQGLITTDSMLTLAKYHEPYSHLISECCLKLILTPENTKAMTALARLYLFLPEFKECKEDGWRLIREAASRGDNDAYIWHGNASFWDKDFPTALEYYAKADCEKSRQALDYLGRMYNKGLGVNRDVAKAIEYDKKAAMLGNMLSQNSLGMHYIDYNNPNPDYVEAFKWLYISADLGYDASRVRLHLPRNFDLSHTDSPQAVDFALRAVVELLKDEVMEETPLYQRGFKKLLQRESQTAATDDFMNFIYGSLYYNGEFVDRNPSKAARYYARLIERNQLPDNMMALAYYRMSKLLANGADGLTPDLQKSQAYLQKAARLGNLQAYLEFEHRPA